MKRVLKWIAGVLCVLVVAAMLFPIFAPSRDGHGRIPTCLSNLKQSSLAMIIYASDENDRFAPRDGWIDASFPYAKNWTIYHCPPDQGTQWGYAFNGALDHLKETKLKDPASTPLVYDSLNPVKNASDLVTSLPPVPRHERNTMGYADGHARMLVKR